MLRRVDLTEEICDGCYEDATGAVAECEDYCALPLDHVGPCLDHAGEGEEGPP
jgi:hypothetical protein